MIINKHDMCINLTILVHLQCYYVGALDTSATRIITSITKPLSYGKPVEKICKDLGKLDAEICELEYGEFIP